jgi:two-component system, chemotaxis family, chemotaxis protein CheY
MSTRILVVDDAAEIRKFLCEGLNSLGFTEVISVATGGEALDLLKSQKFDLTILDIELPDINGKTILNRISVDNNCPVVMCSAFNTVDNVQDTWEMGAKGFLAKPIELNKLANLLKKIGLY